MTVSLTLGTLSNPHYQSDEEQPQRDEDLDQELLEQRVLDRRVGRLEHSPSSSEDDPDKDGNDDDGDSLEGVAGEVDKARGLSEGSARVKESKERHKGW